MPNIAIEKSRTLLSIGSKQVEYRCTFILFFNKYTSIIEISLIIRITTKLNYFLLIQMPLISYINISFNINWLLTPAQVSLSQMLASLACTSSVQPDINIVLESARQVLFPNK